MSAGSVRRSLRALRRGWARHHTVLLVVVTLVAAVAAVGLAALRTDTTPASFLPQGDPSIASIETAARSFGGDPIVVLAESAGPREMLGSDELPKLVGLEGALSRLPDVAVVYGPGTVVNQIAGAAQNMLATLVGKRDATRQRVEQDARARGATPEQAAAQAQAAVSAFDDRYGSLLVRGLPAGLPTVRNPAFIDTVAFDRSGAPTPQMRFVLPSPNAVAILIRPRQGLDQAGTETLVERARATVAQAGLKASRTTVTGTPAVAAELGKTVQHEIPILGGLAIGLIAACYALVPWTRRRAHRLLPLAATLSATALVLAAFGWLDRPLSLGVVAFLPILIGIGSDFPAYVVHGVNRRVVLVAAAASAAGFASLALSPLPFVRDLGIALAAGVLLALAVSLLFRRYVVDRAVAVGSSGAVSSDAAPLRAAPAPSLTRTQRWGGLVAAVAVAAGGWVGLPHLDIEARPDQLAAGLPAVGDALRAEEVLGSSGEVQILVSGGDVDSPAALAWMREAEQTVVLRHGSQLHPIVSLPALLRFLGPLPSPEEISSALQLVPPYLSGSVLRADGRQAVISFGIELQDLADQKVLLDAVRADLPPPLPGLEAAVVGLPVAAARGYELVSSDRYLTNLAGIVAAGLVLVAGLRRRSDAGRAVLAALLATGWGLALGWLFDLSLSPLTVALGSLTTATACEFTLLLTHDDRGGTRRLRRTVAVAATAACLGYLALAVSGLAVIREFGLLLAATVGLSLLSSYAVVWLLPARRVTGSEASQADAPESRAPRQEVRT